MMRTCRRVDGEMMGLVDEQVCYRMFVNYPAQQGRRSRLPARKEGERVQKLEVHWRLPSQDTGWLQDVECVKAFRLDPGVGRKSCTVCLERNSYQDMWIQRRDLAAWSSLAGFEEVVFRVRAAGLLARILRDNPGLGELHTRETFTVLMEGLEWVLGGAEEGNDREGGFLKFRPRLGVVRTTPETLRAKILGGMEGSEEEGFDCEAFAVPSDVIGETGWAGSARPV